MPGSDALTPWTSAQVEAGAWVRRMFQEGRRLRALHGAEAVADLSLGQPLDPTPAVREALRAAASERQPGRFAYMPNLGYPETRERAAADVGHPGVGPQGIAMTTGAAGAISLALRAFVEPGAEVVAVAPHFTEFRLYAETAGVRFVAVPCRDDLAIDAALLERALTPATGALILNSPNNPSGHVMDEAELQGVVDVLETHRRRHGRPVLLVMDEVYRRLVYPPSHPASVFERYEHSALARSFSKDLGLAGERLGYLALHPSLAGERVERGLELCMRALGFVNAPATLQRAVTLLDSWEVDISPYQELRDRAHAGALAAGLEAFEPQGALYLWARSPWPDTIAFVGALAERCVLISPGIAFGSPEHVRLCITAGARALDQAFRTMAELIADGGKGGIRTPEGAL